jgi:segregation and condensation protein B
MYGTTPGFLQYFGLKDLTELPTLKEFEEVDIPEPPEGLPEDAAVTDSAQESPVEDMHPVEDEEEIQRERDDMVQQREEYEENDTQPQDRNDSDAAQSQEEIETDKEQTSDDEVKREGQT